MLYYNKGSHDTVLTDDDLKNGLFDALDKIKTVKPINKVLIIPPDFTRYHSRAGILTSHAYSYFRNIISDILPALGTHTPMTTTEIERMFPGVPLKLFREHRWRSDLKTLGRVPGSYIKEQTEGNSPSTGRHR